MFISVVIPTYNRRSILEKCLQALEHQDPSGEIENYEVVVVDDGSSDGTPIGCVKRQLASPISAWWNNNTADLPKAVIAALIMPKGM